MRQVLAAKVGGFPRSFYVLVAGTFVNRAGGFIEPFLVLWLTAERGFADARAGIALAVFGAGALLSQPLGGWLADRAGRKATIVGGMVATAVCLGGLAAAPGYAAVLALAGATGVAVDLYRPASSAMVADLVPSEDRPRAFGLLFWALNLGFAAAGTIAGLLAEAGFALLFLGDALTCLVFAALLWRLVPETLPDRARARAAADAAEPRSGLGEVLADRMLLAMTGLTFGYAAVYFQMFATLPLVMADRGLRPAAYGIVLAANGVVIVLLQPFVSERLTRLPRGPVLAVGYLVVGIGFGAAQLATSTLAFIACAVVWTVGEIAWAAVAPAIVADLAPEHLRGRYQGVFGLSFGAAAVAAPAVGTVLLGIGGPALLFGCCLAVGTAVAVAQLALSSSLTRRLAPA